MKLNKQLDSKIERRRKNAVKSALSEALILHNVNPAFLDNNRLRMEPRSDGRKVWYLDNKPLLEYHTPHINGDKVEMPYKIFDPA